MIWGLSSAGRAPALQAGGQRFDPARLHHFIVYFVYVSSLCCGRPLGLASPASWLGNELIIEDIAL